MPFSVSLSESASKARAWACRIKRSVLIGVGLRIRYKPRVPKAVRTLAAIASVLAVSGGCRPKAAPGESAASGTKGPAPLASVVEPLAGERVDIPGGSFVAGSIPGEPGRRPDLEQRRKDVQLGPFRVDR